MLLLCTVSFHFDGGFLAEHNLTERSLKPVWLPRKTWISVLDPWFIWVQVSRQLGSLQMPWLLASVLFFDCGDDADLTGRVHTITEVGCSKDRIRENPQWHRARQIKGMGNWLKALEACFLIFLIVRCYEWWQTIRLCRLWRQEVFLESPCSFPPMLLHFSNDVPSTLLSFFSSIGFIF